MAQKLNIDIVARDKSKQALNGVQKSLGRLKQSIFNLQNAFIGLGAGLVIRNLVNTGKNLENLRVRLKFLLKDTNEGAKAFENMTKFASQVPFSLEEIQSGSGILATVTDNADELQKMLEITGNVASVTGLDFRTTAEQIQRSFSAGIGAADLFREKGVRNMLGFQAGATVSITQTVEAFEKVFGQGGRFGKATDDLARTFEGTMSMLGDKVFAFKKTLLDAGFFAELKNQFGDLDKFLEKNAEQLEKIAIEIGTNLAQATVTAAKGIKMLADNFRDLQSVLGILLVALGGMVKIFAGIGLIVDDINRRIKKLAGVTKEAKEEMQSLSDILSGADANEGFVEPLESALQIIHDFEHELSVKVPTATEKAIQKFKELNENQLEKMKVTMESIRITAIEGIHGAVKKISMSLAESVVHGKNLLSSFRALAEQVLVNVLAHLIEQVALMQIQKFFKKEELDDEAKKDNLIRKQNTNLKRQIVLQTILSALGGGSGGGGGIPFFPKANGGAVQKGQPYMVGEQGAELFIPNQSGQITQSARGTGNGGATNVNFNINTVDASGFEELLVRSRGTITQLINNAVNERGSKNLI